MERLRALHGTLPETVGPVVAKPVAKARRNDFTTLPHLRQVTVARGASSILGLDNPFFRKIEAIDGVKVRINGAWVINFAAYDYLSLNRDPRLAAAVADAVGQFGISAMASRLVGGERDLHLALENALADFIGTEDALVTVSGHATNHGIIRTLMGPGDIVLVDALAHNSIFEGIRASGAAHYTFSHNNLEQLAAWFESSRDRYERVLVVAEGLYSMDGDLPDLAGLIALKDRYDAWLMLDEAHSIGVLGATGRGCAEESGVDVGKIDIVMGTLSKSLCSCGGFIAGSKPLIDTLRHAAPGFVYSVGLSIPNTAASLAALGILKAEPARVARLKDRSRYFHSTALAAGLNVGLSAGFAVAPVIVGDSLRAVWASNALLARGINTLPIIAPAVPDKSARLRFFLTADHQEDQIAFTLAQVAEVLKAAAEQRF